MITRRVFVISLHPFKQLHLVGATRGLISKKPHEGSSLDPANNARAGGFSYTDSFHFHNMVNSNSFTCIKTQTYTKTMMWLQIPLWTIGIAPLVIPKISIMRMAIGRIMHSPRSKFSCNCCQWYTSIWHAKGPQETVIHIPHSFPVLFQHCHYSWSETQSKILAS